MKPEIKLIASYIIGDEFYKEAVREVIKVEMEKISNRFRFIVRWVSDVFFPEIECITFIVEDEKYIYKPFVLMKNMTGKFSTFVVQCIDNVNKIINRSFVILQKHVICNREKIQNSVALSLKGKLSELKLDKMTFVMPFVKDFTVSETPYGYAFYCGIHIAYDECINSELNSLLAIGGILHSFNLLGEIYE